MKNAKYALLALDALCAGLFSLGAAFVCLPAFQLPTQPFFCGAAIVILLAFWALWERFPWQIPAAVGGCLLLIAGGAGLTGKLPELIAAAAGYIRWAWAESVNGSPQFEVYLGANLPVTFLFWIFIRKLPSLWAMTFLAAGLIGYKVVFLPEGWLTPFLLLFGGVILFLPRASRKGAGRLQAQLLAAMLSVPVLGLTVLLGPASNGAWRSAAVGHLVQDVQDFWEYHWGNLPVLPLTSMRSMGLQPQKDHLGGDRETSDTPLITSTQNLLLRGQTLQVYTGTGWEDSDPQANGNFRLDSVFWQGRKQEAFGTNRPPAVSVPLLKELLVEVDADLRTHRNYRSLFVPYRTQRIDLSQSGQELFFNMQGEVYWQSQPQSSIEYHVEGRAWNFRDMDFDKNMLLLEEALAGVGTDAAYTQAAEQCLQLPDTLPEEVKELAEGLARDRRSPYAKAMALRDYLRENCEYTLTPGPTDPSQDFVAAFLEERKGYCTYYASALTVLCRCVSIPARYVTGYGMVAEGKRYRATSATAHAWTEIYLENAGWVPLDALTQTIFEVDSPVPEDTRTGESATASQPTPLPAQEEPSGAFVHEPEGKGISPLVLLWLVPIVLTVGGLAAGKYLRNRRYCLGYVQRRFPQLDRAAEHCCTGLLRLLRLMRLTPQPGETLLNFWGRVAERLPREAGLDWREAGCILDRLRFGEIPPTEAEIALLCEMHQALRTQLRENGNLLYRLWI